MKQWFFVGLQVNASRAYRHDLLDIIGSLSYPVLVLVPDPDPDLEGFGPT